MGYRRYYRVKKWDMGFVVAVVFLVGFITASLVLPQTRVGNLTTISLTGEKSVELTIAAVDAEGSGVTGLLVATVRPGSGQVLVSINDVLAQFDTQLSARTAALAASKYTKLDTSKLDIIYTIKVNASVIEGTSAGASMAAATVLALQDKTPAPHVAMTGAIDENGNVLDVGGVLEKARAVKEQGIDLFLVPEGQSTTTQRNRVRNCRQVGSITYCKVEYESTPVNIGETVGIEVKEVKNLAEAVGYFTSKKSIGEI
ncbi:MAG: hypothetical protein HY513_03415 [Candidatus Aenigmarchaeota archaeon]|nr:hypothetical protein [Candidatus Aenigmarchaeota archaeon]